MIKIISYWKTLAWSLIMLCLFLLPVNNLSIKPPISFISEIVHVVMFFFFTLLLVYDQMKSGSLEKPSFHHYLIAVLLSLLFGSVIELSQSLLGSGRKAEVFDIMFDLLGSILSVGLMLLFYRIFRVQRSKD